MRMEILMKQRKYKRKKKQWSKYYSYLESVSSLALKGQPTAAMNTHINAA
jgi:hypothetical protein